MSIKNHPTIIWFNENSDTLSVGLKKNKIDFNTLKKLAKQAGADDCGFIDIEAATIGEEKEAIVALYPQTKSVISIVSKLHRENVQCVSKDVSDNEFRGGMERSNAVAAKLSVQLKTHGINTLSPSSAFPMDTSHWPGKMWPVSHKTVAVAAGMGKLGHNRLLIHPDFGNFIILGTLLIDQQITSYDVPLNYNPCIKCGLCVAACPTGAVAPDGQFSFINCMVHNYRDRMGGFSDWVENIVKSKDVKSYRSRVKDTETVSMWQSLSYGICNKSSYCMAVCPAGKDNIAAYLTDKKKYRERVLKPLQDNTETIFVLPDSDARDHVIKKFPHKLVKKVGSGVRPSSVQGFLDSLPLVFQKNKSIKINTVYHFIFTGNEDISATVRIKKGLLDIGKGLSGVPDITITADANTWLKFLSKEKNLFIALITRKIKIKGSPGLMKDFAKCFPL